MRLVQLRDRRIELVLGGIDRGQARVAGAQARLELDGLQERLLRFLPLALGEIDLAEHLVQRPGVVVHGRQLLLDERRRAGGISVRQLHLHELRERVDEAGGLRQRRLELLARVRRLALGAQADADEKGALRIVGRELGELAVHLGGLARLAVAHVRRAEQAVRLAQSRHRAGEIVEILDGRLHASRLDVQRGQHQARVDELR